MNYFYAINLSLNLRNGKLVSFEALIRWQHPQKGIVLPIDFIPTAEETGMIVQIGEWVIREACKQNMAWQKQGLPIVRVAVNVAMKQFRLVNFVKIVRDILNETGLDPACLELEITENIINNIDIINTIQELKKLGVQIALDDFGSGSSAFNYLREIPIDRIKIDKSYVTHFESDRGDSIIIQAIIAMAKGLNLEVLAEGVETQKQLDFLKKENCGEVQGFYFSNPLLTTECEKLLRNYDKTMEKILSATRDKTEEC